jgi:hypothetical protein
MMISQASLSFFRKAGYNYRSEVLAAMKCRREGGTQP